MEQLLFGLLMFVFLYLIFVASSFATSFLWNRALSPLLADKINFMMKI